MSATADVDQLLGMTRRQKRMANKIQSHLEDVLAEDLGPDSALGQLNINIDVRPLSLHARSVSLPLLLMQPDVCVRDASHMQDVIMSRDMRIAKIYWRGTGDEDSAERRTPLCPRTRVSCVAHNARVVHACS
jgi:ribosome-binding factor A